MKKNYSNCLNVTAENEELRRKVTDMEGKTLEVASSAEIFQATTSAMTEEQDALATKSKVLGLEVQFMPDLIGETRGFCADVAELENVFMSKLSKVKARRRTVDIEVVTEQACMVRAQHTAPITLLKGDLY